MHGRAADIARLARFDDIMQRLDGFLDRGVIVETMDLVEIDIIHAQPPEGIVDRDRKSTRLNSSHGYISYAVFCLKKKKSLPMFHTNFVIVAPEETFVGGGLLFLRHKFTDRQFWDKFSSFDLTQYYYIENICPLLL